MAPKRHSGIEVGHDPDAYLKRQKLDDDEAKSSDKVKLREWLDRRDLDPKRACVFDVYTYEDRAKRKKGQRSRPKDANVEQLTLGGQDHMKVAWGPSRL